MQNTHEPIEILSPKQIALLQEGYNYEIMKAAFTASLVVPFEPAGRWVLTMTEHFYDVELAPTGCTMSPVDRERVMLTLLAAQGGSELGIHVYWAMALPDGLTPLQIADIFYLVAAYEGVDAYRRSLKVLQQVQTALAEALDEGITIPTRELFQRIVAASQVI
jgi:alkylhydroperoxidase/carboxymuconolactone decarboxylase family protein YurZ